MGIYLYSIRAKAHQVTLPNNERVMAHEIRFLFNGGSFYNPSRLQKAMQAKAEAYWASRDLPKYVILTGEEGVQKHDVVFLWSGKSPFWVDCDAFPGEKLGYVREVFGKLCVGPCQHEPRPETSVPPFDTDTGRDICRHCNYPFGPENPGRAQAYKEQEERAHVEREAKAAEQRRISEETLKKAQALAFQANVISAKTWKVEVKTDGQDWVSNGLRFENRQTAEEYGRRIQSMWTQVREWRVVEAA